MTWVLNHLMWYFHFKVQSRPVLSRVTCQIGPKQNRPQVKLAPGQICPSQIDPKSNRPQIKSYMVYLQPLEFRPHSFFIDFTSHALFYIMMSLPAFVKVGKTNPRFLCRPTTLYIFPRAVGRQSAIYTENSWFASPALGRHISTFRGYRILLTIRNPYINRFSNHFSIHS